jgi:hypothetical protein
MAAMFFYVILCKATQFVENEIFSEIEIIRARTNKRAQKNSIMHVLMKFPSLVRV